MWCWPSPRGRIATLAPSITEAAFAVGAGARVVGGARGAITRRPPRACPSSRPPSRSTWRLWRSSRPTWSSAWKDSFPSGRRRAARVAGRARLRGAVAHARRDPAPARRGRRALRRDAAPATRATSRAWPPCAARYAGRARVRVFLEISHRPLMTIGAGHFMGEALDACGATNVFADLAQAAPQCRGKSTSRATPDAILGTGPEGGEAEFRDAWAGRDGLAAVRRGSLAFVASRALGRPSPRVVEGIEALCLAVDRLRAAARSGRSGAAPARDRARAEHLAGAGRWATRPAARAFMAKATPSFNIAPMSAMRTSPSRSDGTTPSERGLPSFGSPTARGRSSSCRPTA